MKKIITYAVCILLTACSSNPATDAYNAKTVFHAGQEAWLAACPGNGSGKYAFCHDPKILSAVKQANAAADAATQAYEDTATALCPPSVGNIAPACPSSDALKTASAAATASVNAFNQLLKTLGVQS